MLYYNKTSCPLEKHNVLSLREERVVFPISTCWFPQLNTFFLPFQRVASWGASRKIWFCKDFFCCISNRMLLKILVPSNCHKAMTGLENLVAIVKLPVFDRKTYTFLPCLLSIHLPAITWKASSLHNQESDKDSISKPEYINPLTWLPLYPLWRKRYYSTYRKGWPSRKLPTA